MKRIPVAIQRLMDEVRVEKAATPQDYNRAITKHSRSLGYNRVISKHSRS